MLMIVVYIPRSLCPCQVFDVLAKEGFCIGASSALNLVAAKKVAQQLGPGHTVVTMMCDNGMRYASRLFNKSWLDSKGLLGVLPTAYQSFMYDG
eukprot:m.309433 g.309433  ORF g.309433 m.309433 type:complete len:94 (+) comp15945_c10_seq1:1230-1511(+)